MPIRLSGLASGLDTESIVSALVSAYDYKKDKYVKAQTKLSWKQDAWKSLNTKVNSLYSSISNMRYSSNYSLKKTSVSDSTKATVTASGTAINGTQTLRVNKLAQAGYLTSAKLDADTTGSSKLSTLGYTLKSTKGEIQVKVNGETKSFKVDANSTIDNVISGLNDCGVSASYDSTNQRIFISSKSSGADNDFTITAGNVGGMEALGALGLLNATDMQKTSNAVFQKTYDTDGKTLTGITSQFASISATVNNGKITAMSYDADATYDIVKAAVTEIRGAYLTASYEGKDDLVTAEQVAEAKQKIKDYEANGWIDFIGYSEDEWYTTTTDEAVNSVMSKIDTAVKLEASNAGISLAISGTTKFDSAYELGKTSGVNNTYDSASTETAIKSVMNSLRQAYKTLANEEATDAEKDEAKTAINDILTSSDEYTQKVLAYISGSKYGLEAGNNVDGDGNVDYTQDAWYGMSDTVYEKKLNDLLSEIDMAASVKNTELNVNIDSKNTATRVLGEDSEIVLNGATFTSDSNSLNINGLTIQCTGVTSEDITITTNTDTAGLYDKVKEFLTEYNNVINEMMKLYNADSAKDYEPLTDDEKAEMSDTEIEKWEQKIKDSLLRRDTNLSSLITSMTTSMMNTVKINGKDYAWSNFGIHTLGYLNAKDNTNYAYHIDGDSEDTKTAGNEDKLTKALAEDPDTVIDFLKGVTSNLYNALDAKMKSTAVSSVYTVYNDKEMASEYSDYTTLIKTWTQRVSDLEDSYYKKFSAMESALAKLQSNSSSITSLFG